MGGGEQGAVKIDEFFKEFSVKRRAGKWSSGC